MIQTVPCPDAARLRALLVDTDLPDYADLETHLAHCTRCQARLDAIAVGESGWLRDAGRLASSPLNDPEMTKTLHRLRDEWPDDGPPIALDFLKPSDQPGLLGTLGRYQVLEVIGRGAFGIVLKAIDPDLLRPVAIKVLAPYLAPSGTARQRFLREARAAAAVSHDHVVTIHAVEAAELPYLVMEFVSGISLQARLDRDGPLPPRDIARIGHQAACGLAAAHSVGLVHRDIKPANILLENGVERVKITDFGLARAADDARLTQSGTAAGTPLYMSPEQTRGETVDQRSDLFSLGSVLYTMATGFPPFRAGSTMGVLNRIANDPPRPIRETVPDFPAALEAIIMQLLEKDPARRYQLAADVSVRLSGFLADPQGEPEYRPQPEIRSRRRRIPKWLETALPILAGIILVGVVLIVQTKNATIFVEAGDPDIQVTIDGEVLKISGTGVTSVRVKPGEYFIRADKDGKRAEIWQPQGNGGHVYVGPFGRQVVTVAVKADPVQPDVSDTNKMREELGRLMQELTQSGKLLPGKMEPEIAKLSALMMEASNWDTPPEKARQALLEAYKIGRDLSIPPKKPDSSVPPPTLKPSDSPWDEKLKKLTTEFQTLTDRVAKTTVGRVLLVVPPGGSPDKLLGKDEDNFNARRLLALRDQFGLLVPQFQKVTGRWEQAALEARTARVQAEAGRISGDEAQKSELALKDAERSLTTTEQAMAKIVADLKKLADEIDPPLPDFDVAYRKLTDEYDATLLRLVKTPAGRVLALFKEDDLVGDPSIRDAGVPEGSVPTAWKLIGLRRKVSAQVTEIQAAFFDYHATHAGSPNNEKAIKSIHFRMAAIRSLVDDLKAIADEIAPIPVPPEADYKKIMAEYDQLVLRLVDTPIGRVLALIPSDRGWNSVEIRNFFDQDNEKANKAGSLLSMRLKILEQADLATKAIAARTNALQEKAVDPQRGAKPENAARFEENLARFEQEAKFRITALRGLVADLKKVTDELAPAKGK